MASYGFDSIGLDADRPRFTNTQESDDMHVPDPKLDIAMDSGFDATDESPGGANSKVPAVTVAKPEASAANNWRDPDVRGEADIASASCMTWYKVAI